jgi:hypothetical protein
LVLSFETPPKTGKKISYKDCYLKFNPKLKKLIEQNGVYLKIQEIDNDKKMKIAEKREKVKLILKQNIKIVYTKGFVIFYYWATSLEISNLKEITPVKDIYSTIEPTIRKKLTILQHCCE